MTTKMKWKRANGYRFPIICLAEHNTFQYYPNGYLLIINNVIYAYIAKIEPNRPLYFKPCDANYAGKYRYFYRLIIPNATKKKYEVLDFAHLANAKKKAEEIINKHLKAVIL